MTAQPTFSPSPQTPEQPPAPQRRTGRDGVAAVESLVESEDLFVEVVWCTQH